VRQTISSQTTEFFVSAWEFDDVALCTGTQPYPLLRSKRNLPDTYSRIYECGKACERMQPVSTCCRTPSSFYSYSVTENKFSQKSALVYYSRLTKGVTCTTVINSHSKVSDIMLLSPTTNRSAISIFNKLVVHQKRALRTQEHTAFGQSAPAAEFRDQELRTACEEMLLSKQLRVPTKCDPRCAYGVDNLVSLTAEQLLISDAVQRPERNNQDIIPHLPPGIDSISLVSRLILRQRRKGDLKMYKTNTVY
ncbi:hypothetical protein ACTXT7_014317, partial [Hymenolepis weldensis]